MRLLAARVTKFLESYLLVAILVCCIQESLQLFIEMTIPIYHFDELLNLIHANFSTAVRVIQVECKFL